MLRVMNAHRFVLWQALALVFFCTAAFAQVVPTTPRSFVKRNVGNTSSVGSTSISEGSGSSSAGVSMAKPDPMVHTTTYIVLSGARQWTNHDGKPLLAKLIAFEDVTTVTKQSAATSGGASAAPPITGKPTVVRDGKVRLYADKKPYEVPLDKLSAADQAFVETVKRGVEK